MSASSEFSDLLDRVRAGEQAAAWRLIELYGEHVLKVVRRKMGHQLRGRFDSQDFVQNVWKSFFRDRDRLLGMTSPEQLVGYITKMAKHKVIDEVVRQQTAKRNVSREEELQDVPAGAPSPSEVFIVRETWERFMNSQPDQNRRIVELRFQGYTFEEIGAQLGIHERTARRVMEKLLDRGEV